MRKIEQKIAEIQKALADAVNAIDENLPTLAVSKIWYARDSLALVASEQQPMVEALQDGKMQLYAGIMQIEYLQTKFRETGSGNGQIAQMRHTIAKIDAALEKGEGK